MFHKFEAAPRPNSAHGATDAHRMPKQRRWRPSTSFEGTWARNSRCLPIVRQPRLITGRVLQKELRGRGLWSHQLGPAKLGTTQGARACSCTEPTMLVQQCSRQIGRRAERRSERSKWRSGVTEWRSVREGPWHSERSEWSDQAVEWRGAKTAGVTVVWGGSAHERDGAENRKRRGVQAATRGDVRRAR